MSEWKVTLPREKPADGTAHVVLGVKRSTGSRFETGGQLPDKLACLLVRIASQTRPERVQALAAAVDAVLCGDAP